MWIKTVAELDVSNSSMISYYPQIAIDQLQTALIRALILMGNSELTISDEEAQESERVLMGLLHDIRKAQFISVELGDRFENLINDERSRDDSPHSNEGSEEEDDNDDDDVNFFDAGNTGRRRPQNNLPPRYPCRKKQ